LNTTYLYHPPFNSGELAQPCVMALGYFDGIHLGHRRVLNSAKETAKQLGVDFAVLTFFPHPKETLCQEKMNYLMSLSHKEKVLENIGVDRLYIVDFNENFAKLPPSLFIQNYLINLHAVQVVVGFDFHYGYLGQGNVHTLESDGKGTFDVTIVPEIQYKEVKISSSLIRNVVLNGDVRQAADLLGQCYETHGDLSLIPNHQNRSVTNAELRPYRYYLIPAQGIYHIQALWGGNAAEGFASVVTDGQHRNKIDIELHGLHDEPIGPIDCAIQWIKRLPVLDDRASMDNGRIRAGYWEHPLHSHQVLEMETT
jgi:riboflavin kinase/FMN adenylyltransferase